MSSNAEVITAENRSNNKAEITYLGQQPLIGMALTFNEYTYNPEAALNTGTIDFRTSTGQVSLNSAKTIVFPLPKQLVDNISLNVGGKEIGTLGAISAGLVSGATGGNIGQEALNAINGIRNQAQQTAQGLMNGGSLGDLISQGVSGANYLVRSGLGALAPQISQGIEAALGETVNPHQTLTFDGVVLKQHTFTFEFAPRDDKESKYIALALHRMKGYALPTYKNPIGPATGGRGQQGANSSGVINSGVLGRGLLRYPKICQVEFVSPGIDPAFFYRMKPSMISNISIDYTPQGNSLLRGGRPAFINVSLTLVEQAIHTAADYTTPDASLFN